MPCQVTDPKARNCPLWWGMRIIQGWAAQSPLVAPSHLPWCSESPCSLPRVVPAGHQQCPSLSLSPGTAQKSAGFPWTADYKKALPEQQGLGARRFLQSRVYANIWQNQKLSPTFLPSLPAPAGWLKRNKRMWHYCVTGCLMPPSNPHLIVKATFTFSARHAWLQVLIIWIQVRATGSSLPQPSPQWSTASVPM